MPQTPLTKAELDELADRYAPYLRLHPIERFGLANVEWYFEHSTLHGPDITIPHPTIDQLPVNMNDGDDAWWLVMQDAVKPGCPADAKVYVHALWKTGLPYTDLQYWLFYGYNGPGTLYIASTPGGSASVDLAPLGEHWADWELVTVRVDNATGDPLGVYLSQHGDGEWITDLTRFERHGDQFVVYPSLNGHANYAQVGDNPTEAGDFGLVDYHLVNATAAGASFDCRGKLEIVAADFAGVENVRWLEFPYRWGKGTKTYATVDAIKRILYVVLSPFPWLRDVLSGLIDWLARIISQIKSLDDTNGIFGPLTQGGYWNGTSIPALSFDHFYTAINTHRGRPPALVRFGDLYHLYWQDGDENGKGIMHAASANGREWGEITFTGLTTSSGIGALVQGDRITLLYRDGTGRALLCSSSATPERFSGFDNTGLAIDGGPNVAMLGNRMCAVAVDYDGRGVMYAVRDGDGDWVHSYTSQPTNRVVPPAIVAFDGVFRCYYQVKDGQEIMTMTSRDGRDWSDVRSTGVSTSAGPCALVFQDMVQLFYRDAEGNGIMYQRSTNGVDFTNVTYTGLNCDDQPHAAIHDYTMAVVAIDQGGEGIMWLNARSW